MRSFKDFAEWGTSEKIPTLNCLREKVNIKVFAKSRNASIIFIKNLAGQGSYKYFTQELTNFQDFFLSKFKDQIWYKYSPTHI